MSLAHIITNLILLVKLYFYMVDFPYMIQVICSIRQHGQDTKDELASRDLRAELESKERDSKEKREGKTRSFTGEDQF